jgi:hypothetical protein
MRLESTWRGEFACSDRGPTGYIAPTNQLKVRQLPFVLRRQVGFKHAILRERSSECEAQSVLHLSQRTH